MLRPDIGRLCSPNAAAHRGDDSNSLSLERSGSISELYMATGRPSRLRAWVGAASRRRRSVTGLLAPLIDHDQVECFPGLQPWEIAPLRPKPRGVRPAEGVAHVPLGVPLPELALGDDHDGRPDERDNDQHGNSRFRRDSQGPKDQAS
jgi:hypothetical protein